MRVIRRRSQNRFAPLIKIIVSLCMIVGMSFGLAWFWHEYQQSAVSEEASLPQEGSDVSAPTSPTSPTSPPEEETPVTAVTREMASADEEESAEETSEVDAPEDVSVAPEDEAAPSAAPPAPVVGAVPEREAVDNSYFDDAIFFGDSISTGIPLYHIADNATVVAMTGINTQSVNTRECIELEDGRRVTFLEAARQHGPRGKVYIMLGGNGIGFDIETFIGGYETFLRSLKELYPDAVIYLQSMTPVVEGYQNEFDPGLNNDKIDTYNLAILELAKREGVHYLDVNSALKDERGFLPLEASPVDGMHFSPEYYGKWFDYLKTHTVEERT